MPLLPYINKKVEGNGRVSLYVANELIRVLRGTAVDLKKFSKKKNLQVVIKKAKKKRYVN